VRLQAGYLGWREINVEQQFHRLWLVHSGHTPYRPKKRRGRAAAGTSIGPILRAEFASSTEYRKHACLKGWITLAGRNQSAVLARQAFMWRREGMQCPLTAIKYRPVACTSTFRQELPNQGFQIDSMLISRCSPSAMHFHDTRDRHDHILLVKIRLYVCTARAVHVHHIAGRSLKCDRVGCTSAAMPDKTRQTGDQPFVCMP
jgi:hypothetical protein